MTDRFHATLFACLVSVLVAAPRLGATALQVTYSEDVAQGADGEQGNGKWSTVFSAVNTATGNNSCTANFTGSDGKSAVLGTNMGKNSTVPFSMTQGGGVQIQTDGAGGTGGAVITFWSQFICSGPFIVGATYTFSVGGQPSTSVGVPSQIPYGGFVAPANFFTGIALVNISDTDDLTVTVSLNTLAGALEGSSAMTVPPLNQAVFNLNQVTSDPNFQGSVTATGSLPMLGLAIGAVNIPGNVTNPAGSFVVWQAPTIYFDVFSPSYSGTATVTLIPSTTFSESITLTNIVPTGTGTYTATLSVTTAGGVSTSGTVLLNEPQTGTLQMTFPNTIGPWDAGAFGSLVMQPDGSFTGNLDNPAPGNQSMSTITLTPSH